MYVFIKRSMLCHIIRVIMQVLKNLTQPRILLPLKNPDSFQILTFHLNLIYFFFLSVIDGNISFNFWLLSELLFMICQFHSKILNQQTNHFKLVYLFNCNCVPLF